MALNHLELTPEQTATIERLRILGHLSEQEVRVVIINGGLEALRWHVAVRLYTSQPLSISDVAERVGVSRGACIEWFHQHGVAPFSPPEEAASVEQHLNAWLDRELH